MNWKKIGCRRRSASRFGWGKRNQDSTAKLLSALNGTRTRLAAMDADQMQELEPILTPVQRAQWQLMQERFRQQVRAAARQSADSVPSQPQP